MTVAAPRSVEKVDRLYPVAIAQVGRILDRTIALPLLTRGPA
jgi:hypothetical protein